MRFSSSLIWCLAVAGLIWTDSFESTARAAFLKNGVRAGDRSGMAIVRRPSAGARKRIFRPGERKAPGRPAATRSQRHAWFWKIHSPAASAASAARWQAALKTMADRRAGGDGIIDPAILATMATKYRAEIARSARASRVSEALILAVIAVESRGRPGAVSPRGAQGLMQLIPATAQRFDVGNPFDPAQNIAGGAAYLDWLLGEFSGDALLALAGYNAGEGAVHDHHGVPPYAETRDYVVQVLDAVSAAQALCRRTLSGPRQRCALGGGAG